MSLCPKCGSANAWTVRDRVDTTLRCLCGYHRVVFTLLDELDVEDASKITLKLPKPGSNLSKTLLALLALDQADSQRIADHLRENGEEVRSKDISCYLYVLKGKGFVEQAMERKRMIGGSIWRVTDNAQQLIRENESGSIFGCESGTENPDR